MFDSQKIRSWLHNFFCRFSHQTSPQNKSFQISTCSPFPSKDPPPKEGPKTRDLPMPPVPYPERTSSSAGEVHGFSIGQAFADVLLKCLYRLAMKRNGGFLDQHGGKSWRVTWARKQWDLLIWYYIYMYMIHIYMYMIHIYICMYICAYIYIADLCWS